MKLPNHKKDVVRALTIWDAGMHLELKTICFLDCRGLVQVLKRSEGQVLAVQALRCFILKIKSVSSTRVELGTLLV